MIFLGATNKVQPLNLKKDMGLGATILTMDITRMTLTNCSLKGYITKKEQLVIKLLVLLLSPFCNFLGFDTTCSSFCIIRNFVFREVTHPTTQALFHHLKTQ